MSEEITYNSWLETLLRHLAFLTVAGLVFALLYPVYKRMEENRLPNVCQSNLKQMSLAVFQYSQDYDERLPLVNVNDTAISATHPLGWADALQPYLQSTLILQCDKEKDRDEAKKPGSQGYTDYWYNARLNGLEHKNISSIFSTLMFGDGTDATNARYSLSSIPAAWPPSKRHREGGNYAFSDGHVKWLKPDAITTQKPDGKNVTFLVK